MVVLLLVTAPVSNAAAQTFSTSGFASLHATETTQQGTEGVLVNYNNTMSSAVVAFVYLDLTNSAGQTVFVQASGGSFAAGENKTIFFGLTGVQSGTYVASVFVVTSAFVPVSTATSVQVVL